MRYGWLALVTLMLPAPLWAACDPVAAPIEELSYESRYLDDDQSRSEIDPERAEAAEAALAPLDDFVSSLAGRTDEALSGEAPEAGECVVEDLAHWARADALSNLATETVELTIGSRLAAFAIIARQLAQTGDEADHQVISGWLARRLYDQMTFWETAPDGAAQGNLRAWSALAAAEVAALTDDPILRGWAGWSVTYVACTAEPDGSLPQEMSRGALALHYQLHAVAPLTVAAASLAQQGMDLTPNCDGALDRIVAFTLKDVAEGGKLSAARTGEPQTIDAGFEKMKDFRLSWLEAWLVLRPDMALAFDIEARRPLSYSKLGGDQTRIWQRDRH